MSKPASSGIQTSAGGQAFIPSSRRPDGTTRKEIKIRPGYKPPEDVETYKSRSAETWRSKGGRGVPGAEISEIEQNDAEGKSKNAKRREAARKKKESEDHQGVVEVGNAVGNLHVQDDGQVKDTKTNGELDPDAERQKKIRNQLKKLKAVKELKAKKLAGEKLSADQLVKIAKEQEIIRDLVKLDYDGPELEGKPESLAAEARPD
ncbi:hypothetical protein OHC33_009813 [Knufia fluminis]|uniref:WIBG Mago-binding domain-containing protein n=1 Tax=Knufia fluminis TaxID=191047 RepID=A0AAN8IIF8_9EURO|nr:hypothetical protein OHC33_009813 [Knufia fluminis]